MSELHTESAEPEAPPAPPAAEADPAGAEGPPEEIAQDVLGALEDFDQAAAAAAVPGPLEATEPEDPHEFDVALGLTSLGYDEQPERRRSSLTTPRQRLETLDDLYVEYPQLKTGEYSLRVIRDKPTKWAGRDCAGWIDDLQGDVTMEDFRRLFGGGTYQVSVLGGETGGRPHADGRSARRTLDNIKITIQGVPVLRDMSSRDFGYGGGSHPQVETKRLDLEGEEKRELRRQLAKKDEQLLNAVTSGAPTWDAINAVAEKQVEHVSRAHAESLGVLRQEIEDKNRTIARLTQQIDTAKREYDALQERLREEVHEERAKRIEAANRDETQRIKDLRAEHDRELKRIQEAYSEKIERLMADHNRRVEDIQERGDGRRRDDQERHERALNATVLEHNRTVEGLERRHNQEMEHTRQMFESRIRDIERACDQRVESIKETAQNQLQAAQMSANVQTQSANTVAQGQIQMAQQTADSLRSEVELLRHENQSLRDQLAAQHKDPLEAVTEAKSLLDTLGLGGDKGESDDWRAQLASVARNFTDKIPEVARQFAEVRAHNSAVAQQQQMPVHRPPHQLPGQPVAAPRPAPIRRPPATPPPGYDPDAGFDPDDVPLTASPMGHSGEGFYPSSAPMASREHGGPVYHREQPVPPLRPRQEQHAPPAGQQQPPLATGHEPQMGPPVAPEPPAPQRAPEEQPQPEPERVSMPQDFPAPEYQPPPEEAPPTEEQQAAAAAFEEKAGQLVDELEEAIKGGLVGPKLFADQFVKQGGPEMASALVNGVSPEGFRQALKQAGTPHTHIHTRDGQKFLEACWAEVKAILDGHRR
jgi:hypothetical protein